MSGKQQLDVADTPSASSASVSPRLTTTSASPALHSDGGGNKNDDSDNTNNNNRRRRRRKKRGDPPATASATPRGERDSSVSSRSRSIGSQSQLSKVSKGR